VRKLKHLSYSQTIETHRSKRFYVINELLTVMTRLSICNTYHDDETLAEIPIKTLPSPEKNGTYRLMYDWLHGLRFQTHSPHSLIFTFELIASESNPSRWS
jgi:hypothetical protein